MLHECHAHLMMNGSNYKQAVDTHKEQVDEDTLRQTLQNYKDANITFIRDGGDKYGVSKKAKELASEYRIDYRSPIFAIYRKSHYGSILGFGFETIKEYRELIRQVHTSGGDFIKLVASGIMDFDHYGVVTTPWEDAALLKELIHIAHEDGFSTMVHVNTAQQVRDVLLAGADSIEHGYYMDTDCLSLLHDTQAIWVPTLSPTSNLQHTGMFNEAVLERIVNEQSERVCEAVSMGILLGVGSDAGAVCVPHVQGCIGEMNLLQKAIGNHKDALLQLNECIAKGHMAIQKRFLHI